MPEGLRNWAGNLIYSARQVHHPASVAEVQSVVARASKVRALGSRHSFNGIADTEHDLVSTGQLNRILDLDRERATVTIEGGVRYGELARFVRGEGFALPNLASLPHISVAGACATATHGSGVRNPNLAVSVAALEFVRADGERVTLSREADPETFPGAVVSLGALGIVTGMTLDLLPRFEVAQRVYEGLPLARLETAYEEIAALGYSVSLFTHWRGGTIDAGAIDQVWIKRQIGTDAEGFPPNVYEALPADGPRHPIAHMSPVNCTEQMGVPGPWDERLPHFRLEFTPSSGEELQSEYIVPRRHAWGALQALDGLREEIAPLLQICEVRTVKADDLWLSSSYGEDAICFHFTWEQRWPEVRELLPRLEAALEPFGPRPHWGKLFTMDAARIRSRYPRFGDFERLVAQHDPEGKFRNAYLDDLLSGGG